MPVFFIYDAAKTPLSVKSRNFEAAGAAEDQVLHAPPFNPLRELATSGYETKKPSFERRLFYFLNLNS